MIRLFGLVGRAESPNSSAELKSPAGTLKMVVKKYVSARPENLLFHHRLQRAPRANGQSSPDKSKLQCAGLMI
jgi:hypothetical protein